MTTQNKQKEYINFFKKLGKISAKAGKKLATNALKNSARLLETDANVATAAASRNPKAALTTLPEVINLYHMVKDYTLVVFVLILYHLNGSG